MCSQATPAPTYGDPRLPERFWRRVRVTDTGCWEWTGPLYQQHGYGQANLLHGKTSITAHRAAWLSLVGPVPDGLELDHLCRNRPCCNPAHLEPVTHRENTLRGNSPSAVHARKTHCPRGHAYAGENLIARKDGSRECRTCVAMLRRQRYAANREEILAKRRAEYARRKS